MNNITEKPSPKKWREYGLKIFFSADIVGSTAFKQKPGEDARLWFSTVMSFYHRAELEFLKKWDSFKKQIEAENVSDLWFGMPPVVWKTLGDEILFVKDISHPMQAYLSVHAWCQTLEEIRKGFRDKKELDLNVKASVWLADFPIKNKEVVLGRAIPNGEDDYDHLNEDALSSYYEVSQEVSGERSRNLVRDFVGPSIDTGFRLGAFTTPRRLVISVELAHLLACEQSNAEINAEWHFIGATNISRFVFRYEGRHVLKGVFGGKPYPIFWIDLNSENMMHRAEEDLLSQVRPSASKIKSLTEAILSEFKDYIKPPMFAENLAYIDSSKALVTDCHQAICKDTLERVNEYRSEIDRREQMRKNELDDIAATGELSSDDSGLSPAINKIDFKRRILENISKSN